MERVKSCIKSALLFQLIEASETALGHIKGIVSRGEPTNGQAFREQYSLKTTAYYLLLPCAVFKMIRKRLTLVDLQVDPMIYTQYILAKSVYLSYTDDFKLAGSEPYKPYVNDWRKKREENPQVYRRQGFPLGRLDNALDALINHEETGDSFISFGEFEEKFDSVMENDVNSSLGTARDVFFEFRPHTRPVLLRILIVQALLYRCILELSRRRNMASDEILSLIKSTPEEEITKVDSSTSALNLDNGVVRKSFQVAKTYLDRHLKEQLKLLETISKRKLDTDRHSIKS